MLLRIILMLDRNTTLLRRANNSTPQSLSKRTPHHHSIHQVKCVGLITAHLKVGETHLEHPNVTEGNPRQNTTSASEIVLSNNHKTSL